MICYNSGYFTDDINRIDAQIDLYYIHQIENLEIRAIFKKKFKIEIFNFTFIFPRTNYYIFSSVSHFKQTHIHFTVKLFINFTVNNNTVSTPTLKNCGLTVTSLL